MEDLTLSLKSFQGHRQHRQGKSWNCPEVKSYLVASKPREKVHSVMFRLYFFVLLNYLGIIYVATYEYRRYYYEWVVDS